MSTRVSKKQTERAVVILTEFKEIFFGFTTDTSGDRVLLRQARQACYYSADTHGLLGLAVNGPAKGSNIGPTADHLECRRVVNVLECTSEAVAKWEKAKWG